MTTKEYILNNDPIATDCVNSYDGFYLHGIEYENGNNVAYISQLHAYNKTITFHKVKIYPNVNSINGAYIVITDKYGDKQYKSRQPLANFIRCGTAWVPKLYNKDIFKNYSF